MSSVNNIGEGISYALTYVQLNRRFAPFTEVSITEDFIVRSYSESLFFSRSTLAWDDLLKRRLTVVLGEQGSGKSEEFRRRAALLCDLGKAAFFVRLENLLNSDLRSVLAECDERRFSIWVKSGEAGIFFLDSVDESKLIKAGDFDNALQRFAKDVTSAGLKRATIVLSSRVSKWSPLTDGERVMQCLGFLRSRVTGIDTSEKDEDNLHVVRLLPLDESMILKLLECNGFADVSHIRNMFNKFHLWGYVRRPSDALRYARSVDDGVDVGSLTQVLDRDIAFRLRESCDREQNDLLTPIKALAGARSLAAAVVLTRRRAVIVPDVKIDSESRGVDPVKCLPTDWSPSDVQRLLSRSLFDGASLGTIRFHDPRVRDFLAAQWFQDKFSEQCPTATVKDVLCAEFPDGLVVRDEMESMLAWIASGNSRLSLEARNWILDAAPELFFSHGDPGQLPTEYRQKILNAYLNRFSGRDHIRTATDPECLARFAEKSLEPDLNSIVTSEAVGEDSRILAMWIMRHGRLSGCLEAVMTLAFDANQSTAIRTSAIAVIRDVGNDACRHRLMQLVADAASIPEKLVGILIETMFPAVASADVVASLVRKTESRSDSEERLNRAYWLISHFEDQLNAQNSIDLLRALIPLAEQAPVITLNDMPLRLSAEFQWLGPWFPTLLQKTVLSHVPSEAEVGIIARAWAWLEEFCVSTNRMATLPNEFVEATKQHPTLRREYFWLRYQDHLNREGEPQSAFEFLGFQGEGGFDASPHDLNWLVADIEQLSDPVRKKIALSSWIAIWQQYGRLPVELKRVQTVVAGYDSLSELLRQRVRRTRHPRLKQFWYGFVRQKLMDGFWWARAWWFLKKRYKKLRDKVWLHAHLRDLRSGKRSDILSELTSEATDNDSFRVAPTNWVGLRRKYGRRIADAVCAGCHQVWLDYEPKLPHEKAAASRTWGERAGLAGLSTGIVSNEIRIETLSDAEVEKAIRYAVTELNGLPAWFTQLVECHTDTVRRVLTKAIAGEWNWSGERILFGVLHDIRWGDPRLRELLAAEISDLMEMSEPSEPSVLLLALQCLVDAPTHILCRLSALSTRTLDVSKCDGDRFTHWCVTEIQLNPDSALDRLDRLSPDDERDVQTALRVVAELSGENFNSRPPSFQNAQSWTPQQMKRLLLLCHRFIRTADDIKRHGVYTPTSRDLAQRFRDSLITLLANNEKSETPMILRTLLDEPELRAYSDYILDLIARRRRTDAASLPWIEQDVAEFANAFEINPKSGEELYLITRRRLTQLRYDVEESDNSYRDEVRTDHDEKALCRWIGRKLSERSRDRYVVPLETEIDLEERPDLRIEYPGLPPVPIEVKWAENWSYNELVERLTNQLFGQYLRARDNRHGFFLLGYIDDAKKKSWKKDAGESMNFAKLLADLQLVADGLVKCHAAVSAVTVIGIDFRIPK